MDPHYLHTDFANHTLALSARLEPHNYLQVPEDRDSVWCRLTDALGANTARRTLISSEVFMEGVDIPFIRDALTGFQLSFVFYIRRQDHYIESYYAETVKYGNRWSLAELFREVIASGQYDLAMQIDPWQAGFPDAELIVREYDRHIFPNGDIAQDLLNAVGVPLATSDLHTLESVSDRNPRLPDACIELVRRFNALPVSDAEKQSFVQRLTVLQRSEPRLDLLPPARLTSEMRETLLRFSTESNLALVRRFGLNGPFFNERALLEREI